MSVQNIKQSKEDGGISLNLSNERLRNREVLAGVVASATMGIFGGHLVVIGLVGLGIVSLPFTWPVLAGILVGAVIVGAVALAVFYSSKNKMVEVIGDIHPDKEISAQEKFTLQAKAACRNLRSGEMLTDNTMQFVVLAMSVLYNRKCDLILSTGKPFQEYKFEFTIPLSKDKPTLRVRAVCIEGQGLPQGLLSRLQGEVGYIENHATCFIENEYFDPKGLSYTKSIHCKEPVTQTTIGDIRQELDQIFTDYHYEPVQDFLDTRSCGVHVLRRIQQYFMGTQDKPLAKLSKQEISEVRELFASWIEDYIINENRVGVSAIISPSKDEVSWGSDDFNM